MTHPGLWPAEREGQAEAAQQTDSGPRGGGAAAALLTGHRLLRLLQGFQIARPSASSSSPPSPLFSCFLLPRVHAAAAAAADEAPPSYSSSTSSSSSSSSLAAPPPIVPGGNVPRLVGRPEFPDTGWDRIKDLFDREQNQRYPEELSNVIKGGLAAAVGGMIYGGLPAARDARQRFIQLSQAEMYTSRVEAVRSAHHAAVRGFVRYGWRWSWRVTAFVTLFNSVSTGLSVYRDNSALSHYAAAGAVTGGLFRLNLGLRGVVAGTVIGAAMGLPTGVLILAMQSLSGETARERRRRECRELYQLKLDEWTARLQLTDELIGDLGPGADTANRDLERIKELLSLPPNEGVAQDTTSQ